MNINICNKNINKIRHNININIRREISIKSGIISISVLDAKYQ